MTRRILIVLPWLLLIILGIAFLSTRPFVIPKVPQTPNLLSSVSQTPTPGEEDHLVSVTRVIDGDTVEIQGGERVRYIGVDTPERDECFGPEATQANKGLVEGKKVRLEKDVQEKDKYGRMLTYVWIEDVMVNERLVQEGYAQVATYPPNVRYQERFVKAQEEARKGNRGLWAPNTCSASSTPGEVRAATPEVGVQVEGVRTECEIKGNINSTGEKIYHMPGQRYYDKTQIEETRGERWFCSEEEAVQAGWRKSKV
ncbi:MAG: thermonuclease family protein [Candidatus Blackburnbacteria bacterium]|nr:thermonuclease family protein [Candidatus Blackburnbacteria bacterium]